MQRVLALARTQISTAYLPAVVLLSMFGNGKGKLNSSFNGGKATGQALPLHPIRESIIADRTDTRVWCTRLEPLLASVKRTLDRFRGFHTSGTYQLRRQVGILTAQIVVGALMQFNAITALSEG
ncbi:hypothetical protein [Ktedonospora formicarum]|nr:hypothetical protein [Ktedonospora formicarum]